MGAVSLAVAQTTSTATSSVSGEIKPIRLPANRVEIGPGGEASIAGSVVAVTGGSISFKSWGGIWIANTASDTIITGLGGKVGVSQIRIGDTVAVHGKMSADSGLTLQANVIKDYSLLKTSPGEIKNMDEQKNGSKNGDHGDTQKTNSGFWERIKGFFQGKNQNSE